MRGVVVACILALVAGGAWADVRLPKIFSDNMVLQRNKPIVVWGWADPGEEVTVELSGGSIEQGLVERVKTADGNEVWKIVTRTMAKTTADAQGNWQVQLIAQQDMNAIKNGVDRTVPFVGLTLTVTGKNTITLKNILIGDVWVCSGQSNMAMQLGSCNAPEDIAAADFPLIRCVKVENLTAPNPANDYPRPLAWQVCTPATAGKFTAAGFYFAREITQQTKVPIGLIDVNWGGTRIESWLPLSTLGSVPEVEDIRKDGLAQLAAYRAKLPAYLDALDAWSKATRAMLAANGDLAAIPPQPAVPEHPSKVGGYPGPFALYNGMIHPLLRLPITGALWYQGEANGGEGDSYYHKMRDLIGTWRALWGQGDFPFYYVQLANYRAAITDPAGGDGWAKIRCAQAKALVIPNTGMASAIDIGEAGDIHPKNKYDVGARLARWALARDYGKKDLVPSGPLFKEMTVEGNKIRLSFDYAGSGLMVGKKDGRAPVAEDAAGKLTRFAIAGEDQAWVWADAVIDGNTVLVSSPKVPNPVAVRYAFSMNPAGANLYNKDGLPASPFRTDSW